MIGFEFSGPDRDDRCGRGRRHGHGRPGPDARREDFFGGHDAPGGWQNPWAMHPEAMHPWAMRAWRGWGFARRGCWPGAETARDGAAHHTEPMHAGNDEMFGGRGWRPHGHRHERMFGRGFGGPRGPGRPGRPLGQGDLRWLVLDLIAAQPRHGYEIIKAIEDALNGHYTPSPGVIYPTLTLLEETGLISGEAQGAKKLYSLTEEGRAEVQSHSAEIRAVYERLAEARARFGGAPPPELFRAMDNLRAALQVRLAKGELSPEALRALTAAIDRAAAEIEHS